MKSGFLLVVSMLAVCFFSAPSFSEEVRFSGRPGGDFQIIVTDQSAFAFNPACIDWKYLATNDRNRDKTGPEDSSEIKPEWQVPELMEGGPYPMLSGVYRFKVKYPDCSEIHVATNITFGITSEFHWGTFEDPSFITLMTKNGETVQKLAPGLKKGNYYYTLIYFSGKGDLANIPKDRITVGHLVPDNMGFISRFVEAGGAHPFKPFYPFIRIYRAL